jgi:solute:Na+ symporter, SSS family
MLTTLDWSVIIGFIILIVAVGLSYTSKSGKNIESFFLGGRNLPWWLAGLSMVATTFAADTPLAVTEIVGTNGIAGNWLWWNFLAGGMLTTFFFAKLWQRSGVLTEAEFIELRYSGKEASFLRGFKAVYLGLFMNVMIIGWVNVAMMTLLQVFFGLDFWMSWVWTAVIMVLVALYSSMSGLLGVAVTDAIQFFVAMAGCILLALYVINSDDIGGIDSLKTQVQEIQPAALNFFPTIGKAEGATLGLSVMSFISYIGILWWASWYPGAEPGGGGYIAQRMMSTRSEKDAFWATLFFQIAHYCIRPWPWILVGLACITLYSVPKHVENSTLKLKIETLKKENNLSDAVFAYSPEKIAELSSKDEKIAKIQSELLQINSSLSEKAKENKALNISLQYAQDQRKGFVFAMNDYLPAGLLGLLLVAFFAAYMSTISTQLNWGAGYLVNDLYKRFIRTDKSDKHYVAVSRITTIALGLIGMFISIFITKISGAWAFIMQCGAGLGLVLILRWYWWRINAWSEIAAMIAPALITIPFYYFEVSFDIAFPSTVAFTTIIWLLVTYKTEPSKIDTLKAFYQKVKPMGNWSPVSEMPNNRRGILKTALNWLTAIVFTYSVLFFFGNLVLAEWTAAAILLIPVLLLGYRLQGVLHKDGI